MPTIRDVATRAGVSTATVSATLNGTAFVSPELKERVIAAVRELGYAPDAIARSLKQGRTHLIGLIVGDITNPYFTELTQVIEATAQTQGYSVLLCDTNQEFQKEREYLQLMRTYRVEGLILAATGRPDDYDLAEMHGLRMPVVLVDRALPLLPFDSVMLDNVLAATQAMNHILAFGHRRIGMIGGPRHLSVASEREEGYRLALQQQGIEYDGRLVRDGNFREEDAFTVSQELLSRSDRPSALFVANNHMLIGVMRAIADLGLQCPRDVSIVSIDDFRWANAFTPRMTTVNQPIPEIGHAAIRLLLDRLARKATTDPVHLVMMPTLRVRDSCKQVVFEPAERTTATIASMPASRNAFDHE
ncbi:MAG TPA: LacI family DNA-binding transcriptional regulator [Magnetospirillaceae bacterium]|jgi:LacI family transcriptional regulator